MTNRTRKVCSQFVCKAIALVCAALIAFAFAQESRGETFVNVNAAAYHFDREAVKEHDFNENNLGLGLEYSSKNWGVLAGEYKNSLRKTSWYVLGRYSPLHFGNVDVGIVAGALTGYAQPISPAVGLIVSAQWEKVGFNVILTPSIPEKGAYGFAGLQLRYKLW